LKTAFLFPGQGSQFVGMGKDICEAYPEARAVFEEANEVLGQDIKRLCFEGPDKELGLTINTQPAILSVSIAILRVLQKGQLRADFLSGHSLGEYSALVAAEALSFADALKTVRSRAQFMQSSVKGGSEAMAAVLGYPQEKIVNLFKILRLEGQVFIANVNCPGQIVIAGGKGPVEDFIAEAKKAGAKRCIILDVSVPSHCPLMKRASELLQEYLDTIQIKAPLVGKGKFGLLLSGRFLRSSDGKSLCIFYLTGALIFLLRLVQERYCPIFYVELISKHKVWP